MLHQFVMNAFDLRKRLIQLWTPTLINESDLHVEIGDMDWVPGGYEYGGMYLNKNTPREIWKAYHETHDSDLDFHGDMILVTPVLDSSGNYLQHAVHEFAHLIRHQLNSFYPFPPKASLSERVLREIDIFGKTLTGVPKERFNLWKKNVIFHENQGLTLEQQQYLSDFIEAIFPEDRKTHDESLFGKYAHHWWQFDCGHDPLFYFVFYTLHRKADDMAFFKTDHTPVVSSTFIPEEVAPAKLVIQSLSS